MGIVLRVLFFAALLANGASWMPAGATTPVDLELVLAVDMSRSVDDLEAQQQRDGYIAAFQDPAVIRAIQSGSYGAIAVAYVEWSGLDQQRTLIDWTLIQDGESAAEFALRLQELPRHSWGWTSVSGAIDYSVREFERSPYRGMRRVIDVSGDGANNSGRPAHFARDEAVAKGITINGLPILNDRPNFGGPAEVDLNVYYETQVIGGPGAFMIAAEDYQAFGRAILAKLLREIADNGASSTIASTD
jgi:hypothetical protein